MNLKRSKKISDCEDPVWDTIKAYDTATEDYCRKTLSSGDRDFQEKMMDRTLNMLPSEPRILDLGCGDGRDAAYLTDRGADTIGMDLSKEMVKLARKKFPELEFIRMDMRELGLNKDHFDCVWASASVIHIPGEQLRELEREIIRVLKPGGIFAFSYKVGQGEGFEYGESMKDKKRYFVYHTEKSIRNGFDELEIIDVVEYPGNILGSSFAYCWMK